MPGSLSVSGRQTKMWQTRCLACSQGSHRPAECFLPRHAGSQRLRFVGQQIALQVSTMIMLLGGVAGTIMLPHAPPQSRPPPPPSPQKSPAVAPLPPRPPLPPPLSRSAWPTSPPPPLQRALLHSPALTSLPLAPAFLPPPFSPHPQISGGKGERPVLTAPLTLSGEAAGARLHDIARRMDICSKMAGAHGVGRGHLGLPSLGGSLRMQVKDILHDLASNAIITSSNSDALARQTTDAPPTALEKQGPIEPGPRSSGRHDVPPPQNFQDPDCGSLWSDATTISYLEQWVDLRRALCMDERHIGTWDLDAARVHDLDRKHPEGRS